MELHAMNQVQGVNEHQGSSTSTKVYLFECKRSSQTLKQLSLANKYLLKYVGPD